MTIPKQQKANTEQHARFLETARALGCDKDEAAFDEKLKAIATRELDTAKLFGSKPMEQSKPTTNGRPKRAATAKT